MRTDASFTVPDNGTDPLPDQPAAKAAPAAASSRSAGLLSLVRSLIAFGHALIGTLQASPAAGALFEITTRFGTCNLTLIIARITRGLMLAANLDARLVRTASRLDTPPERPATAAAADSALGRTRAAPASAQTQQDDDAALLARLPTAQEIAAQLRGKPIGVVLEAICHDLGITCAHPLWRALQHAIIANGGNAVRVFNGIQQRLTGGWVPPPTGLFPKAVNPLAVAMAFAPTGTGPS